MKIDFSKEEVNFIMESMEYAKMSLDTSISPHLVDPMYPKSVYEEKKKLFSIILNKLKQSNQ